jgi:hypothetical protein
MECPISKNMNSSFTVAVYNPSLISVSYIKMKVPHGMYRVN